MLKSVPNPPRYTDHPLPPHRFLPGDERQAEIPPLPEPPALQDAPSWRSCTAYLYGCDLYNHGFWWESHEIWEELWHPAAKAPPPRLQHAFLQGLIQVAACAIKLEQGKSRGVQTLLRSSEGHLGEVIAHIGDESFMGLRVARWYTGVQRYYRESHRHNEQFPLIVLGD